MAAVCSSVFPRIAPLKEGRSSSPLTAPVNRHYAQRNLSNLAFNPAMDSSTWRTATQLPFVRPDVPPEAVEAADDAKFKASAESAYKARPQFRSALEQVSYMTNNKLWDSQQGKELGQHRQQRIRLGIFGL